MAVEFPISHGCTEKWPSLTDVREGDRERDMSLRCSKAPASTSQTAQAHSTVGKSSDSVALFPLWQPWSAGGKISGQHEPCWLLQQIYNAALQVVATGLYFFFHLWPLHILTPKAVSLTSQTWSLYCSAAAETEGFWQWRVWSLLWRYFLFPMNP